MALSPKIKQQLKARAHHLKPIVLLGQHGLTDAVLKEIDIALTDHELIKVKYATLDRNGRQEAFSSMCASLKADCVQLIGNIAILYRKNEEEK